MSDQPLWDLSNEVPEGEEDATHGEVPQDLMEIHLAIEAAGMTPEEFAETFKAKGAKK